MTITQRIELRRLGYTKEEIAELAEMERTTQEQPAPETPEQPAPETPEQPAQQNEPDTAKQLLAAINNLTLTLQGNKLIQTPQPETKPETAADVFNSMLKG